MSFLDANGVILYEMTDYYDSYLGCMKYMYLEYYGNKICQRMVSLSYQWCMEQVVNSTMWDYVRVVFNQDGKIQYLGEFVLNLTYNYTQYTEHQCWDCTSGFYNPNATSIGKTCEENMKLIG